MVSSTGQIALLLCMVCYFVNVEAQGFNALSYTILKLHTFKTETEACKIQYANTRFIARPNSTLEFGLAPNCTLCENLKLQDHLIRIHKSVMKFVQPIIDVNAFENSGPYSQLRTCVRNIQHVLFTLKALTEIQIPASVASQHLQTSTHDLKTKTENYLKSLKEFAAKQPSNGDIMSELSVVLIRELYVTAVVLQKDRIAMQKLASSTTTISNNNII